jgi:alpha-galactosidase
MWAMMASPLFAGNDVRNMKSDIKDILTNKEIIAVNQDILGKQATKIVQVESREVWLKPLYDSRAHAVAVLNRLDDSAYTVIEWKQLGLTGKRYLVRDLWKRLDDGIYTDKYEVVIPAHGTVVLLLKNYDL